jgi:deoxycytidine triphosphate deaminase
MIQHTERRYQEAEELKRIPPSEDDPHPEIHGVLLSNEIIFYATKHNLITPFDRRNLKPAAYELSVGDEYFLSGKFSRLGGEGEDNAVVIPPFEVAILKTAEILRIPRYMIARWNIRVKHAYAGLLWVGAPQVDPGYVGHLFCPIYNLSDKHVTLNVGDPLAVMDFVKTSPFDSKDSHNKDSDYVRYPFPPKRSFLEDYGIDDLRSALFTKAGEKLGEFEESIRNLETRFVTFTQLSFAIFAVVIALIIGSSKAGSEIVATGEILLGSLTLALSIWAVLVATFSYVHWRMGRVLHQQYGRLVTYSGRTVAQYLRRATFLGFAISLALASAGAYCAFRISSPLFDDIRKHRVLVKSDLDLVNSDVAQSITKFSGRLDTLERATAMAPDDLQRLKLELERRLQALEVSIQQQRR